MLSLLPEPDGSATVEGRGCRKGWEDTSMQRHVLQAVQGRYVGVLRGALQRHHLWRSEQLQALAYHPDPAAARTNVMAAAMDQFYVVVVAAARRGDISMLDAVLRSELALLVWGHAQDAAEDDAMIAAGPVVAMAAAGVYGDAALLRWLARAQLPGAPPSDLLQLRGVFLPAMGPWLRPDVKPVNALFAVQWAIFGGRPHGTGRKGRAGPLAPDVVVDVVRALIEGWPSDGLALDWLVGDALADYIMPDHEAIVPVLHWLAALPQLPEGASKVTAFTRTALSGCVQSSLWDADAYAAALSWVERAEEVVGEGEGEWDDDDEAWGEDGVIQEVEDGGDADDEDGHEGDGGGDDGWW